MKAVNEFKVAQNFVISKLVLFLQFKRHHIASTLFQKKNSQPL